MPCRSGSPHGVFGTPRFAAAALFDPVAVRSCPDAGSATSDSAAISPAAVEIVRTCRVLIETSLGRVRVQIMLTTEATESTEKIKSLEPVKCHVDVISSHTL